MSLDYFLGAGILLVLTVLVLSHMRTSRALTRIGADYAALSNAARDVAAGQARDGERRHAELLEMVGELRDVLALAEERQLRRNLEELSTVLAGVVADFNVQLNALSATAESSQELYRKQRNEQMEAMHHARRLVAQMDQATEQFGRLAAESSVLASLAGEVRDSLALLGPRQDAIDSGIGQQATSVQAMADAICDLRAGFDEAAEQLIAQSRRAFDTMSQRAAQSNNALNKEINEALAKGMSAISKQLTTAHQLKPYGINPPAASGRTGRY